MNGQKVTILLLILPKTPGKIEINFNQILTEKVVITYTTEIDFDKADLSEGSFVIMLP